MRYIPSMQRISIALLAVTLCNAVETTVVDFEQTPPVLTNRNEALAGSIVEHVIIGRLGRKLLLLRPQWNADSSGSVTMPATLPNGSSELVLWLRGSSAGSKLQINLVAEDGGIFSATVDVPAEPGRTVTVSYRSLVFNKWSAVPPEASQTFIAGSIRKLMLTTYKDLAGLTPAERILLDDPMAR
jgi:hypothetical protein